MHTNPVRKGKQKINIITLGCSKNLVDSEEMLTQMKGNALDAVHESQDQADTVIINTCGFIDRAKEESVNTILDFAGQRSEGKIKQLIVTGCLSERYKDELANEIPEVDAWFGTQNLPEILRQVGADYKQELVGERQTTTDAHYAYLKIAEGCDRPCSFCAIPLMRGGHRSRTIESLVQEASFLVSRGVKEIMLIAQDLTYYGLDLYKSRKLKDLLIALSDIKGLEWIRLHYAFPSGFPEDILPVMRERQNICNYLDMPLQHISDDLLRSMRRGTTRDKTYRLIDKIRQEVPGIALRTTLITGYPGETDQHHSELLQFVQDVEFERLGVFTYSHEENTHAFQLDDDVPEDEKEARRGEVMELQQEISMEKNSRFRGTNQKVLIDRFENGWFVGRTEYDSPEVDNEVLIRSVKPLETGNFYEVKITDSTEFDLIGEI